MARRLKLTDEAMDAILLATKAGATVKIAAAAAGVSDSAIFAWVRRGEEAEERRLNGERINRNDARCLKFVKRLREVKGKAVVRNLAIITDAAKKDWRAAAWLAERMAPDAFGKAAINMQINAGEGGDVVVTFADAIDAALAEEVNGQARLEDPEQPRALPPSEMVIDVEP